ncbi:tetratricopeptide repeat protein [Paractinoplanes rishiriensis]|uniref:tetratricopeptide repeat protein n=1 Tax=Paractinoplanes rishiriensis TaxID=1050105 RepID=UPI001EF1C181|nr:tetratricopeptide repeat protein [Actinoplanes rishiriensis]
MAGAPAEPDRIRPGGAPIATSLPDPGASTTLDELVERLRALKVWAGDPSFETIKDRVGAAWRAAGRPASELPGRTTVLDCFRPGRKRLNADLVVAIVAVLCPEPGYPEQWQQALRVIGQEQKATAQVRVHDALPPDQPFSGRDRELGALHRAPAGGVHVITGMAGVGKTQLAIHAGHRLLHARRLDRVLYVNLRGFHPDPAQPPADPAAVLDGFLRLLGVPAQQIPHGLPERAAAYRERLAGERALVVLDNAADEEQVGPLLPAAPDALTLVTSRRRLDGLPTLTVDVFDPAEAGHFLTRAVEGIPAGADPDARTRIAERCGHLPFALALASAHIQATPGWTLTDHADRLDQRHRDRRLDTAVELALDLSYHHLPDTHRRLLRLLSLHPAQDFDAHAAAALADTDPDTAGKHLADLARDHLLQPAAAGRWVFHDLVRAYAAGRAEDEEPPGARRAARTRLFDGYVHTAARAMDTLFPAEAHRRPAVPPAAVSLPQPVDPQAAHAWLDAERITLIAVAAQSPGHAVLLGALLFRYFEGNYHADGEIVHDHACRAAERSGDVIAHAHARTNRGSARSRLGRYDEATADFGRALDIFRAAGDPAGQARTLNNMAIVEARLGRYRVAADHLAEAVEQCRAAGDLSGESRSAGNLGVLEARLGNHEAAVAHYERGLALCRRIGDRSSEVMGLLNLAATETKLDRRDQADTRLREALALARELGDRLTEGRVQDQLGELHHPAGAAHYREAVEIAREIGDPEGEASALNGLGRAAPSATEALSFFAEAAAVTADRYQQARAYQGLGESYRLLGRLGEAEEAYGEALSRYEDQNSPEADVVRERLSRLRP